MVAGNGADKSRNIVRSIFGGEQQSYNANFARAVGGIGCAVFVQYVSRWGGAAEDGWCFRTDVQIEEDTALTRKMIVRIRSILTERGLLQERRNGTPARMYYRIDERALLLMLAEANPAQPIPDSEGEQVRTKGTNLIDQKGRTSPAERDEQIKENTKDRELEKDSPLKGEDATPAKRGRPRTRIAEDWGYGVEGETYAKSLGMTEREIDLEAEKFFQYFKGEGKVKADWHATWCNWCLAAIDRRRR